MTILFDMILNNICQLTHIWKSCLHEKIIYELLFIEFFN